MFDRDYRGLGKMWIEVCGGMWNPNPEELYRSYIMTASISESV